jgi:hypothetical protein
MALRKDAFLISLWSDSGSLDEETAVAGEWRGSIEHLSTHRRRYFTELSELIAFLSAYLERSHTRDTDFSSG